MKRYRNALFYIIVTTVFSILMYLVAVFGAKMEKGAGNIIEPGQNTYWVDFLTTIKYNLTHPLALLLAQIVIIIVVARILGWMFKRIGQPTVIGEILAGIVLGPSLIGMYFPEFSSALFPTHSLGNLMLLSQIGLVLFMFIVGMEIDINVLRNKAKEAVVVSHASIIIPFALGMLLSYFLYQNFAPDGVQFLSFSLFIGIAMSITAFPVLARIVQERGIHRTKLGTIVITCAAADDITGWSILAAVIAIVQAGSFASSIFTILLAIVYVLVMIKLIRPFLKRVGDLHSTKAQLSKPIVALFILVLILSAWATEVIGIHALFGAFMAGAIMPANAKFRHIFIEKIEDISLVLLLPLFFVFTGLRTEIGLLNQVHLWLITGAIILVAIIGKFLGSALAARFVGQSWKDSLTIGALMNTRGLMELVILNIGYDLGVLSPEIFAMMVIMALITTFMTGPVLDLIDWIFKGKGAEESVITELSNKFKILISFAKPESGKVLVRLASAFVKKQNGGASVTAIHLHTNLNTHHYNLDEFEASSFAPVLDESKKQNLKVNTVFKITGNVNDEITEFASPTEYNLLLIGMGQSIFDGSILGRILGFTSRIVNPDNIYNQTRLKENIFEQSVLDERTKLIIAKSKITVGVLINKGLMGFENICVTIINSSDGYLFDYARQIAENCDSNVSVFDITDQFSLHSSMQARLELFEQALPDKVTTKAKNQLTPELLTRQNLMLVSLESWRELISLKSNWLADIPSVLIISHKSAQSRE